MSTAGTDLLLLVYPSKKRFRQTNGGASYRSSSNDFILDFNLEFINRSPQTVTINPVGTVRVLNKDGDQIAIWTLDYSRFAPIAVGPNSSSTGWWFNIWGFGAKELRDKNIVGVSVTFNVPDYPVKGRSSVITDSTSWKAKLGPGINIIKVGVESFTASDNQKVLDAIRITREIYEQVDFTLRDLEWWQLTNAQAGNDAMPTSTSQADDLASNWSVKNDKIDLFVVRSAVGFDGYSPIGGPCDKNAKGMTGSVVSLNGSTANAGNTFAHELGHYMGLDHIADTGNFIGNNGSSDSNTGIEVWQYKKMRDHCAVKYLV